MLERTQKVSIVVVVEVVRERKRGDEPVFGCVRVAEHSVLTVLRHEQQENGGNNIHGLAIPNTLIPPRVRHQNSVKHINSQFCLVHRMLRQTPVKVLLDIIVGGRDQVPVPLVQVIVVVKRGLAKHRPAVAQPKVPPEPHWHAVDHKPLEGGRLVDTASPAAVLHKVVVPRLPQFTLIGLLLLSPLERKGMCVVKDTLSLQRKKERKTGTYMSWFLPMTKLRPIFM